MKKILLVDDEYLERDVLRMILGSRSNQFQVVGEAENGLEAVKFVKEHDVDIVIMDIKMPKMTGLEASRLIREYNPRMGIIIVSAYNDFEFAQHAIQYSLDDYLLKPSRPEHIFEALERTVRKMHQYNEPAKNHKDDIKTVFLTFCRNGDYIRAKKYLRKMKNLQLDSYEKEKEVTRILLESLLTAAEYFGIDVEKNLQIKVKEKLTTSKTREQYFQILELIFEELFDVIISEKRVVHKEEMTYALHFIEKHLTNSLTLESAASYMNISTHYFSKLFKSEVGENFIDYVTAKKVERAKELIMDTDLPLNVLAFELGFNEANYFSKVFKKKTGVTPSQYRKEVEEKAAEEKNLFRKGNYAVNGKWII
ncbi:response regulator [Proteiniclasticum sp. C24MP]|uniref:response regulator transcription factor n=1 Tax=Proteiniclasticum sp. C24MP TaxID=3374101 RepID=UPI0037551508